jgi:hypothetical protein
MTFISGNWIYQINEYHKQFCSFMVTHCATSDQWENVENWSKEFRSTDSCLLELRDRLIAAEQRIQTLENNLPLVKEVILQLPEEPPIEYPPASLDQRDKPAWYFGYSCGWQAARAALAKQSNQSEQG